MTKALQDIQKANIALTLPDESGAISKIFKPSTSAASIKVAASVLGGERGIVAELKEEGDAVLKQLREQQREVIDSLDLKQ